MRIEDTYTTQERITRVDDLDFSLAEKKLIKETEEKKIKISDEIFLLCQLLSELNNSIKKIRI